MGGWVWAPKGKATFPSQSTFSYHIWQIGRAQTTQFEPSVRRGRGSSARKKSRTPLSWNTCIQCPWNVSDWCLFGSEYRICIRASEGILWPHIEQISTQARMNKCSRAKSVSKAKKIRFSREGTGCRRTIWRPKIFWITGRVLPKRVWLGNKASNIINHGRPDNF